MDNSPITTANPLSNYVDRDSVIENKKKGLNEFRINLREIFVALIDYIKLHLKIKSNPYFTKFGLDKVTKIDDTVLKQVKLAINRLLVDTSQHLDQNEYNKQSTFYNELKKYKEYDERFQLKKNELDEINTDDLIKIQLYKEVSQAWLQVIDDLSSSRDYQPFLSAKQVQTIITDILRYPIPIPPRKVSEITKMLDEIDLEFSKKLEKMVLSEPESELGGRRVDEQQNLMDSAFLRANRSLMHRPQLPRLTPPLRRTIGGRQYKRTRKSSTAKRHPRRKSSTIKRRLRRRRTSRK
jgi:hypothetical protein